MLYQIDIGYRVAAQRYWRRSREWRGHETYIVTIGGLIEGINRAKDLSSSRPLVVERLLRLLQEVIMLKRCRKTKGTNNVVPFPIRYKGTQTGRWHCQ